MNTIVFYAVDGAVKIREARASSAQRGVISDLSDRRHVCACVSPQVSRKREQSVHPLCESSAMIDDITWSEYIGRSVISVLVFAGCAGQREKEWHTHSSTQGVWEE